MPETPIDQAPNLTSVRLKIPTGTVPIPPAGYGQLHEPSPGVLALRLPDGSVVVIGPGGGGGGTTLENDRGLVTVEQVGSQPYDITLFDKGGNGVQTGRLYSNVGVLQARVNQLGGEIAGQVPQWNADSGGSWEAAGAVLQRIPGSPFIATGVELEHLFTLPAGASLLVVVALVKFPEGGSAVDLAISANDAAAFDMLVASVSDVGAVHARLEAQVTPDGDVAVVSQSPTAPLSSAWSFATGPLETLRVYSNDGTTPFGAGTTVDVFAAHGA